MIIPPASELSTARATSPRKRAGLLAMAALIALTLGLGGWQFWRGLGKYQQGIQTEAMPLKWYRGIPADFSSLLLYGRWQPSACFEAGPRSRDGRAGVELVCPFVLQDGSLLLINRGWLADGQAEPPLPAVPLRAFSQPWPRFIELGPTPESGRRFQNIDPQRFARWAGLGSPAAYAVAVQPAGLAEASQRSPLSHWRHWAYALSWWLMSLCGLLLWRQLRRDEW